MATAGDGRAPFEIGGAGEKLPIRTETSSGISDQGCTSAFSWISKLGQMLQQVTVSMSALSISTIPHGYLYSRFEVQHPDTMENLPDELLINIFIRLQARQLAQMRSVSKLWNALLSHPSFVKSHLHHSMHNNSQQILLAIPDGDQQFTEYFGRSSHLEPTNVIKHIPANLPMIYSVIGSVNGLICFSSKISYYDIRVWNPSLSAVSTIPLLHAIPGGPFRKSTFMRFGFDPENDDYKIVWIGGLYDSGIGGVKEWLPVQVYSMRKRTWEFITQPVPSHITWIAKYNYLCADGHDGYLHWVMNTVVKTERKILAFDLGSETFREIPFPDSNLAVDNLGVLDGKLCKTTWSRDGGWEVSVMEEYGVPGSWVKRYVFPQFTDVGWRYLYGTTSRNELVYRDKDERLALYDPIANTTRFTRTKQRDYAFTIVEYVESLVWL